MIDHQRAKWLGYVWWLGTDSVIYEVVEWDSDRKRGCKTGFEEVWNQQLERKHEEHKTIGRYLMQLNTETTGARKIQRQQKSRRIWTTVDRKCVGVNFLNWLIDWWKREY